MAGLPFGDPGFGSLKYLDESYFKVPFFIFYSYGIFVQVNSTTAIPKAGSPNEQIAVDSTWTISGLAMGTDYHFLYKVGT